VNAPLHQASDQAAARTLLRAWGARIELAGLHIAAAQAGLDEERIGPAGALTLLAEAMVILAAENEGDPP
jgi:hypothetical protein